LPACTRIAFGKGVCGTAAVQKKSVLVPDVDQFPGHIVCDSASKSEVVVPLIHENKILGVLDIDSPTVARFTEEDQVGLEEIVQILIQNTNWPEKF
jgi:GAF domain-containing protein